MKVLPIIMLVLVTRRYCVAILYYTFTYLRLIYNGIILRQNLKIYIELYIMTKKNHRNKSQRNILKKI